MSFFSPSSSRILALYTDGITTTGAVFRKRRGKPEEIARVTARGSDPEATLAGILEALKAAGTTPPKKVILASDRAALTRVELPVHPNQPRPYAQMRELARWESEMAFSDLPSWDLEKILTTSGAVNKTSNERVQKEIASRAELSLGGPDPRYQDVALSLGVIDRAKRDMAIETLERLNQPVGEAGCSWIAVERKDHGDFGQHGWILSAVSESDREAWREACKMNNLVLTGIVPAWGLSDAIARHHIENLETNPEKSPAKDTGDSTAPRLLLERHNGAIALVNLIGKAVESIRLVNLNRPDTMEHDMLHRILDGREQEKIVAVGFSTDALSVVRKSFPQVVAMDDTPGAVLYGAAARGLALRVATSWPQVVAPSEPRPPIWKNDNFYRAALIAIVVSGLGFVDISTRLKVAKVTQQLETLDADFENRRLVAKTIRAAVGEVKAIQRKIDQVTVQIDDLKQREKIAIYLQTRRQMVVEGLLLALRHSIPKGVVMRELAESTKTPEVFTLSAWALTDIDAERFIARLNNTIKPLGLVVADETVFRAPGPQQLPGYGAQLRIVPLSFAPQVDEPEPSK